MRFTLNLGYSFHEAVSKLFSVQWQYDRRIDKDVAMSRNYTGICLEGLRKSTKALILSSWYPDQASKFVPPEYKSTLLSQDSLLRLLLNIFMMIFNSQHKRM
jgi:hypothetical protein